MSGMEFHPLSNLFPLIEGAEFAQLVADVKEHGLREPVVVSGGMILDGRNRFRACQAAEVECRFHIYAGADPVAYVVSANLRRRHMDESQRAMVAAKLANLKQGGNRRPAQTADMRFEGEEPALPRIGTITAAPPYPPGVTTARAAEMLNVAPRTVEAARAVQTKGVPELAAAVEAGEIAVTPAAEIAKLPAAEQPAAVAAHNHRAQGTGENEWYTPKEYIAAAREVLQGIDLDPASSPLANETVGADRIFTLDDDGLEQEWAGRVWLNPPYAQPWIARFAEKAVAERASGRITAAIVLTHNYTDTSWFHTLASAADAICFTRGRIGFVSPDGKRAAPTQGQAFFYIGSDRARFAERFSSIGLVVVRHGV